MGLHRDADERVTSPSGLPASLAISYQPSHTSNMCSSQESWQPPPIPAIAGFGQPAEVPDARPVWVLLDELCVHRGATERTVVDGLDFTGRAKGFLLDWRRTGRGDWLGVVNYEVGYVDGRRSTVWWREQLVPGYALRPRKKS
jgi:hypothetical protein